MSNSAGSKTKVRPTPKRVAPELSKDLFVYALLGILIWIAREVTQLHLFKQGDNTSYWLGVLGATLMLILFIYPLRKHFRFASNWGSVKGWLVFHMVLGIGGPMIILVHSEFRFGSLNAGVALLSMIIVVASGVIGRFIYTRINRGLHGEQTTLEEIRIRAGLEQEGSRSRLRFAPNVETLLLDFSRRERDAHLNWQTHLRRVCILPWVQWWLFAKCNLKVRAVLNSLAIQRGWSSSELARHKRLAAKLIGSYLQAEVRVAQFTAYHWTFSAWHIAHIPFVFLLVGATLVHIFAIHAY
jgi:hypothetical protein